MVMIKRHFLFLFTLLQNFNSVLCDADNLRLVHVVSTRHSQMLNLTELGRLTYLKKKKKPFKISP